MKDVQGEMSLSQTGTKQFIYQRPKVVSYSKQKRAIFCTKYKSFIASIVYDTLQAFHEEGVPWPTLAPFCLRPCGNINQTKRLSELKFQKQWFWLIHISSTETNWLTIHAIGYEFNNFNLFLLILISTFPKSLTAAGLEIQMPPS